VNALACTLTTSAERDVLWQHSRNALGVARLLVNEDRPEALIATSCHVAVEMACRAALEQTGLRFDGNVRQALRWLAAPSDLWPSVESASGLRRLVAAERAVAWVAGYLKNEAPERSWGY
jgi:hypothetical protein